MGDVVHNALVVTSWNAEELRLAAQYAWAQGLVCLGPSNAQTNGYCTMVVVPCGSKRGWEDHRHHLESLVLFKAYLRQPRAPDDAPFEWVEVEYSGDLGTCLIADSRWFR